MNILGLSISHHETPVEFREILSFSNEKLRSLLRACVPHEGAFRLSGLAELSVLSTCNRFEAYAVSHSGRYEDLVGFLSNMTGVGESIFTSHAVQRENREAVTHLFRVSSGLDSMVLGETQILGQVTGAYDLSRECGSTGPILSALFRAAIHAGKRAHTETAISRNAGSVGSIAARLAVETIGDISNAHVVIIGAGEMAELAVEALRHRDAQHITVVNRTREKADMLAARWQARAFGFERVTEALRDADVVISSTGAPHVVLTRELIGELMGNRPSTPLILIDIAVPRDIDPEVKQVPNVHYYDIDSLEGMLSDSLAERQNAIPDVEAILEAEIDAFMEYLRSLDVVPVVTALRAKADEIRRAETEKALRHLAHLSDEDRARVEFLGRSVLDRFLHDPTLRLKAAASRGCGPEYAETIRYLFNLSENESDELETGKQGDGA